MALGHRKKKLATQANLEYAGATLLAILLIVLIQSKFSGAPSDTDSVAEDQSSQSDAIGKPSARSLSADSSKNNATANPGNTINNNPEHQNSGLSAATLVAQLPFALDADLQQLLFDGNNDEVNQILLQKASAAVAIGANQELGEAIALLGSVALLEHDTDGASVYLDEALAIFEEQDDELGSAGVELLRGQLNIEKRWQAREAAFAYDAMQIAGWKIAKGRLGEAVVELEQIIESNMQLNRYGAAAAGYEALYRGYKKSNLSGQAVEAGIEAAKLHAASGRTLKADKLLDSLGQSGLDAGSRQSLKQELAVLQRDYESSVRQVGNARNYEQLYYHYINEGDPVRAWQFRLKSRESINGISKRAMHRRQTGVIALLYNSNKDMQQATNALQRAEQVFQHHDADHLMDISDALRLKIY